MTLKKIEINERNPANNEWDQVYIKTSADIVTITDAANKFTATDVEGALSELFTFANDGKNGTISVVGLPATSGNTFAQVNAHIQNAKNKGAANLTAKGTAANGSESLDVLMGKIANVSTGKKFATGTVKSSYFESNFTRKSGVVITNYSINVKGLAFKPSVIIAYLESDDSFILYKENFDPDFSTIVGSEFFKSISPLRVNETEFFLPAGYATSQREAQYTWWAYE